MRTKCVVIVSVLVFSFFASMPPTAQEVLPVRPWLCRHFLTASAEV